MFNPFVAFDPRFLPCFKQKGVKAFVQQTYDRGRNMLEQDPQPAFLLVHYNEIDKAREHFEMIKTTTGQRLYLVDNPTHWQELEALLNKPSGNRFYTILTIEDVNQKAKKYLDKKIRYYINFRTNWRPSRGEQIAFSLDIIFGEIYVLLKYGPHQVKMPIDEFETLSHVL